MTGILGGRLPDDAHTPQGLKLQVALAPLAPLAIAGGAVALLRGAPVEEARTVAVNTLVAMEVFYLFSVRYLRAPSFTFEGVKGTKPVLIAVFAVFGLQLLFTYAPFMETFFHSRPLSFATGLQIVAVGVALLVLLEIEKFLRRRLLAK